MAHITIPGADVSANAIIDESLMKDKFKNNDDDHEIRILALEAGGGGGGGGDAVGAIGEIISGGETNEAIYFKRRFHPLEHLLNADSKNPSGFDPEGKSLKNELLQFIQSNDAGILQVPNNENYIGQAVTIAKDSRLSFKIKKGVNFFSIATNIHTSFCDNIEIFIDGQTPSSLGLLDENGDAAPDTYSTSSATIFFQVARFFYGLDGEEHTIDIINNDSAAKLVEFSFIEVGFRSENPSIDKSIHINAGKATIKGSEVSFNDSEFVFGNTELNGHTGAIVCDTAGALSKLDGESPAMTQCKPEENVAFSSPVTQLKVKNNFYFPANGICLLSTPYGNHHLFSYQGKTAAAVQSHSLDDLLWQSQPSEDFTPLNGFTSATLGDATGDLNINYYGTAPILIDSSNNKIDFKVTIGGVTTTHAATIANGRYAADLVPLEVAVRVAMQAVKSINGEYHCKYSAASQLWEIFIDGNEIEAFELLFSTGANTANSVHTTLGFSDSDNTGAFSYIGSIEKQHLCCRVLEADSVFITSEDPRIKYASSNAIDAIAQREDIEQRLGLTVRKLALTANMIMIFPDDDCSGLEVVFMRHQDGAVMSYQIDDGQVLYLHTTDTTLAPTSIRGILTSAFLSFPRGSRKITIRNETEANFKIASAANNIYFVGCRQYFTKPAYEKMEADQAIIKTFDISPISLYATLYGNNGGVLYSPNAQDDNINTISEVGSWNGNTDSTAFNSGQRFTSTLNDYVEVDFTLIGNGGGVFIKNKCETGKSTRISLFISSAAINETTDRVGNTNTKWATITAPSDLLGITGLSAGTYKARFKLDGPGQLSVFAFGIIDTVAPQENANTLNALNNIGQGITYPINVIRESFMQDSADKVPSWLTRSGYKEGKVSLCNYSLNSPSITNYDDNSSIIAQAGESYYGAFFGDNVINTEYSMAGFYKSITILNRSHASDSPNNAIFIDGVQTLNNYDVGVNVLGGSAPSTRDSCARMIQKLFILSCTHNAGLVFNINDTRGLKNNATIILDDGVNKEIAVIDSFVVGVSFTIKKSLSTVVAANVTTIDYQGFHNLKAVPVVAGIYLISAFEYEPLKVSPSKAIRRRALKFEYEKVSITHDGVANGDDLFYPVHSDGVVGNWQTSTIEMIGNNGSGFDFPQDLKNITVTSGILTVKISSERLVPVLSEQERF